MEIWPQTFKLRRVFRLSHIAVPPCTGPVWFQRKKKGFIHILYHLSAGVDGTARPVGTGDGQIGGVCSELLPLLTPTPVQSPCDSEINSSWQSQRFYAWLGPSAIPCMVWFMKHLNFHLKIQMPFCHQILWDAKHEPVQYHRNWRCALANFDANEEHFLNKETFYCSYKFTATLETFNFHSCVF